MFEPFRGYTRGRPGSKTFKKGQTARKGKKRSLHAGHAISLLEIGNFVCFFIRISFPPEFYTVLAIDSFPGVSDGSARVKKGQTGSKNIRPPENANSHLEIRTLVCSVIRKSLPEEFFTVLTVCSF